MNPVPPSTRIVLVRPRNPLNIGAAARAMLNFGLHDLVVVAPHEPIWREAKSAVGAAKVLRQARMVDDLTEAIGDCTLVIGTSSLARRQVSQAVVSLDELEVKLGSELPKSRLAVVFGSEKTGLGRAELERCNVIVRIPTGDDCPSMNLSQAVAVCCYELKRVFSQPSSRRKSAKTKKQPMSIQPASAAEIERLTAAVGRLLSGATSPPPGRLRARLQHFHRMLLRWPVSSIDVSLVLGLIRDLEWKSSHGQLVK